MVSDPVSIGVFGLDGNSIGDDLYSLAYRLGKKAAINGNSIVSDGLGGVMEASFKGATDNGGTTIAIVQSDNFEQTNPFCSQVIRAGSETDANNIIANRINASVIINGREATRRKAVQTYEELIPIFSYMNSGGVAQELFNGYIDERKLTCVRRAKSPSRVIHEAQFLGGNRRKLIERLNEVGLDIGIYKEKPPKYVRQNPRNEISKEMLGKILKTYMHETGIPGVYRIDQKASYSKESHDRGDFYFNDLASLIPIFLLGLNDGDSVLDMCSSPGIKSSFAFDLMDGKISLTCVEKNPRRYANMIELFERSGVPANAIFSDSRKYDHDTGFDKVFVDVPCSGEGYTTKYDSLLTRHYKTIPHLAIIQQSLLQKGFESLKIGGTLVYSTCTLNKTENEGVVGDFLGNNASAELQIPSIDGFDIDYNKSDYGIRIVPGKTKGMFFTYIKRNKAA